MIYNNNFTIGTLIVGSNGTLDIVGGSLTVVNGATDNGTIIVEGDPPALTINGPVMVGDIGSFTATGSGDEIQFANGTVDNHGAISALNQGTVSFVNEGMTNDADGKILARGKGSEIDFANAILTNIGIIAATHHGEVRLTDVTLQNGINGVIAADDGGKIWITDLQHGSTNYGLVEAFDGGKITIVGYNNNGGGSGGSGHNGNFGNIDAIGCSSSVDIESHNGGSFDNQNGGTVAALEGGKVLFSGDVTNHEGGAIEAAGCDTHVEFSNGNLDNSGDITAKHDGVITLDSESVTNEAGATVVADDAFDQVRRRWGSNARLRSTRTITGSLNSQYRRQSDKRYQWGGGTFEAENYGRSSSAIAATRRRPGRQSGTIEAKCRRTSSRSTTSRSRTKSAA